MVYTSPLCVSTKYSAMIVLYCLDVRTYNEHEGNHHKCLPVVSIKCGKTLPGVLANNGEGLRRST